MSYDIDPRGSFWPVRAGANQIGRKDAAEGLDIEIEHPTVSSNHATLHVEADKGMAQLEDLKSANGTFLNDGAIAGQGRREIRDGDRIRCGAVNLVVKLVD